MVNVRNSNQTNIELTSDEIKRGQKYLDWHVNSHVIRVEAACIGHGRSLEYLGQGAGLAFRRPELTRSCPI